MFDSLIKEFLDVDALVLNDLLFTEKGSTFQIDSLILTGDKVLLFEVKTMQEIFNLTHGTRKPNHFSYTNSRSLFSNEPA